jgi:hypothetical protein
MIFIWLSKKVLRIVQLVKPVGEAVMLSSDAGQLERPGHQAVAPDGA